MKTITVLLLPVLLFSNTPKISVSPDSLSASLFTGGMDTQVVQISNTGNSDLIYSITTEYEGVQAVSIEFLGNVDYPQSVSDVWGYTAPDGTELAIVGTYTGTSFIEVSTDPAQPTEVGFITGPSSSWRDIKTYSHYAYIVTEGGGGLQIVDLTDPQNPVLASTYTTSFNSAHNLFIDEAGFAYIVGSNTANGGLHILDLTDPVDPIVAGNWSDRYVHDVFVRHDTAYTASIWNGTLDIVDVTTKSSPTWLAGITTSGFFTHNVWLTDDGNYALTTDEVFGGYVDIYDIRDLNSITRVAQYRVGPNHIPHNVFVKGNLAYLSAYVDGVVVLDISDPTTPLLVGQYDTYEGLETGYAGAWGVYPFAGQNLIYVSDMQSGLYVLEESRWLSASPGTGTVAAGSSADVTVTFDAAGLFGGDYEASILILNNDPVDPLVAVAVSLNVTGAPDIWVDTDTLDYGETFVNYGDVIELIIGNDGTDILEITSITTDNDAFTVSLSSMTLDYDSLSKVDVTFLPTAVGDYTGTLTIVSNDQDEGVLIIPLFSSAVEPPIISVVPDSVSADLFTNDSTQQIFTIANTGVTDLVYELSVAAQGRAKTVSTISHPFGKGEYSIPSIDHAASKEIKSRHKDKQRFSLEELRARWTSRNEISTKIKKPRHQRGFNEKSSANDRDRSWSLLYTDPDEPELIYDIQYVYGDVKTDEVLFKLESYVAWTDPYDNGIAMIYIDADQDQSTGADFDSYFGWGIGVEYWILREGSEFDGLYIWDDNYENFVWIDDLTTNIVEANSNETIVGVDGVQFDEFSAINFAMLAGSYIEDPDFVPDIGMGHITFEFAPSWLKLSSEDGVISAGSQKDITVTFDATDLFGGDYFANILVVSNDPANPEMSIPAHLSVTGIPIYSGLDSVDFGISYVGYENVTTFVIDNLGTDVLEISDITSDDVQLSVSPTTLSIPPVSSDTLFLVLLAETEGLFSATVNMTTNDPDASEVSASVQSSVLIAPDISVSPDAIDLTTDAGSEVSETMTIGNEGGSDLNYHINIFYEDGTRDEGGPDDFGYKWKDSNEPNGPDFDWIDASGGTVIYLSDDDYAMGIPLGFTFSYYGEEYGTINIMSNGWVSFTDFDSWFPEQVPDPNGYYFGVIAPFGGDLYPPDGVVRYKTMGTAPDRIFVVEFNGVPWCCSGPPYMTFEVLFYESGDKIRFQYFDLQGNSPEAIGISSPDNSTGLGNGSEGITYISPYIVENNYAIEFSAQTEWLSVVPSSGVIPIGDSFNLTVTADAAELDSAFYTAEIVIVSNDPDEQKVTIPVTLTVTGVGIGEGEMLPDKFALHQNYPNPFNPITTIQYDLPEVSDVRLVIYDLLGREVITLIQDKQEAGYQSVIWNGRDRLGREVATGIYIYQLIAGDPSSGSGRAFVSTKKLVLIK